jgi:hypothetical protein
MLQGEDIEVDTARYRTKHTQQIRTLQLPPQELEKEHMETLQLILPQYHRHWEVFSEKAA